MFAVILALGAALGWGISDFLGGLKSRSVAMLSVLLISQAAALILLIVIVAALGEGRPDSRFILYAAVAGLAETVGVAALYRGLAVGVMSIVAPVAAIAPVVLLTAVTAIVAVVALRRSRLAVQRTDFAMLTLIGALIVSADFMYATATTLGLLGVVAVLGALHTVVTIGLARIYLHERLERLQGLGIAACLMGVLIITAS